MDAPPIETAAAYAVPDTGTRAGLIALRRLILAEAATLPEIGRLQEALRWGQPAFLTPDTKAGSSLRIGTHKAARFALFVHCQTTLIAEYREQFDGLDRLDGNRAILFDQAKEIDPTRHGWLIRRALTYHLARQPA